MKEGAKKKKLFLPKVSGNGSGFLQVKRVEEVEGV